MFSSPAWYRALTVLERHELLKQSERHLSQNDDGEIGRQYLERWREQYPFETDQYFSLLLEHKEMSREEYEQALSASEETLSVYAGSAPTWLTEIELAYSDPKSQPFEPPEGEEVIGFLNLIDPLLEQALYRLLQEVERLLEKHQSVPFDAETIDDVLLMNLPELIIQRLGRTLVLELNVLRLEDKLEGDSGRQRFLHFLRTLREPEYVRALYEEYPILARQLSITINQWLDVSLECLTRLCADWELLKSTFSPEQDPGPLVRLAGGAGDTHRRGRSVMIAEFESGLRIVYKPKSLAIDIHFQSLVDWLNDVGCQPRLRNFITLDRIDYGWAEFVTREECTSEEDLRRFYRRQGIYLALLHVLASTDFHFENVIASGEHPMLIDLETMLQPVFERYDVTNAEAKALKHMGDSVLAIGLLPMRIWSFGEDYEGIDISGLGGAGGQLSPDRIPGLADQGTDAMRYVRERVEIDGDANRPMLEGVEANAIDYLDEIAAGFETMYGLIMRHQQELLRPGGLIDQFDDDLIRVLMRPTRTYWQLLYESFHPDMLRNALDRDLFLDRLWLVVPGRNHMKEIIASEQEDLLHGDIPVFTSYPSSLALYDASERAIPGVLIERGTENVRNRISNLSEEDLERQLWYIRASIASVAADDGSEPYREYATGSPGVKPCRSRLNSAVRAAADYVCADAFETETEVSWIGLQSQGEQYWSIATLGIDLYAGSPGIALFLAYAGELLAESRYSDLARKAYRTIQLQSELASDSWASIGGYEGWGGILYLFTHLGSLWADDDIFAEADRIANRIWGYIEQDTGYDVVRGSAGAIQALLTLHAVRPSDTLVKLATMCGLHLVENAQAQDSGIGWIPTRFGDKALAGYGHGASGIATSLLRLYTVTRESRFLDCAAQALQYERSMFDSAAANWRDLRAEEGYDHPSPYDEDGNVVAWCGGASGIGLARLELLRMMDDHSLMGETDRAITTTLEHGFGYTHCLCHGDLGSLEFLLQAAGHAEWSGLSKDVDMWSGLILDDIDRYGWRCGGPKGVLMPGMMVGVAGIGYQLLRLAEPSAIPSILMLAPPADESGAMHQSRLAPESESG